MGDENFMSDSARESARAAADTTDRAIEILTVITMSNSPDSLTLGLVGIGFDFESPVEQAMLAMGTFAAAALHEFWEHGVGAHECFVSPARMVRQAAVVSAEHRAEMRAAGDPGAVVPDWLDHAPSGVPSTVVPDTIPLGWLPDPEEPSDG